MKIRRTFAAGALAIASVTGSLVAGTAASAAPPDAPGVPTKSVTVQEETAMRQTKADVVARSARALPTPVAKAPDANSRLGGLAKPNGAEKRVPGTVPAGSAVGTAATPVTGTAGSNAGANAPFWPGAYNANPNRQVGKLFFYDPVGKRNSWCSATAVTSANKSTIVTAGHCVYNPDPDKNGVIDGNGKWMTSFQFCPGYENSCKLGTWTYRRASTTNNWFYGYANTKKYDFRDDVAVVLLNKDASGRYLTNAVGGQGMWFNGPTNVWRTAIGYPATDTRFPGYTYTAQDAIYCQNNDTADSSYVGTLWIPCTMTGGASGGPWITWAGTNWMGYVNSVNSHKPWGGAYMNGPYFDTAEQNLYNTWQTQ